MGPPRLLLLKMKRGKGEPFPILYFLYIKWKNPPPQPYKFPSPRAPGSRLPAPPQGSGPPIFIKKVIEREKGNLSIQFFLKINGETITLGCHSTYYYY